MDNEVLNIIKEIRKIALKTNGQTKKDQNNIALIFNYCDRVIDKGAN